MEADQKYLHELTCGLADKPGEVSVDRQVDDRGVLLTVRAATDDISRIIGRDGETAKALRRIMRVFGSRRKTIVSVKVEPPA